MKINVGIDLGTTYSAVATFNKALGKVEILKNDLDKDCTPSVICIENEVVTIGEEAKEMQSAGNLNTASFYKSMMGEEGAVLFLDNKDYTPEDLSAEYLRKLKENIEKKNNVEIDGAVITVPAYFQEKQRNATINAGKKAGLKILKIINEPTSAIIAYGLTGQGKKNVMIYDLGGGTFDVTIAEVNGTKVSVLSTNGNHQLGGKDWDLALLNELINKFRDEFGVSISDYPEHYKELQVKCEEVKKKLTNLSSTVVSVNCEGYSGKYTINREFFELQSISLLNETLMLIQKCFNEIGKGFGWSSIDEVVLVGGSTRMPQVKEMIMREYGKAPITKNIDVDTIVAAGAAMQAELCTENMLVLGGSSARSASAGTSTAPSGGLVIRGSDIQDITAHSLGMLALASNEKDYVNSIIIAKNSKMNQSFGREYTFAGDALEVYVLQGESTNPYENSLLYKYVISSINKQQKSKITVNFLYNNNGVVEVNATLDDGTRLSARQNPITESLEEIISRLNKQREEHKKRICSLEVMLLLDTSGSMDDEPIKEAKKAMLSFVNDLDLNYAKASIVIFGNTCKCMCNFTNDRLMLTSTVNSISINGICGYGTSAKPLSEFGNQFSNRSANRIIVVLTDGVWSNQASEIAAAKKLKASGITIYAVGVSGADQSFLEAIASVSGAKKIDLSALTTTFKEIASSIATETSNNTIR